MTKIVFLDIDGVINSLRSALMPENQELVKGFDRKHHSRSEMALKVTFDPTAIALINRLCEKTGAKIVVHSSWNHTIGIDETRAKIIEQGILEKYLHDPGMEMKISPTCDGGKWRQSQWWQKDHEDEVEEGGWIIIDDHVINDYGAPPPQIQPTFQDGFTAALYRVACGYLGGLDDALGVIPVAEDDWDLATRAFGDRMAAAHWLYTIEGDNTEQYMVRARLLDEGGLQKEYEAYAMFGVGGGTDASHVRQLRIDELHDIINSRCLWCHVIFEKPLTEMGLTCLESTLTGLGFGLEDFCWRGPKSQACWEANLTRKQRECAAELLQPFGIELIEGSYDPGRGQ